MVDAEIDAVDSVPLRIGYKASAEQFGPVDLASYAVLAETLGFDSVWVSDHVQPWRHRGGHAPASVPLLGFLAARTARVLLGTSVLTPTFRYHPGVLAQEFATLAGLAPGRVALGVGTGEALNEQVMGALPGARETPGGSWPPFSARLARLVEAVTLMRRLWAGEAVTASQPSGQGSESGPADTPYWPVRDLRLYDPPPAPIPVYVAGGGPKIARVAGRLGDGFIATSGKGRTLYEDQLMPAVAAGLAEHDPARTRGSAPYDRMIELKVSYDPDPARALDNVRFWAPLSLPAETKNSLGDPAAMEAAADALPLEQVAARWVVASRPEEVVDAAREYIALGFTHLVLHGPGADQERFLRTVAADVLPALSALGRAGW